LSLFLGNLGVQEVTEVGLLVGKGSGNNHDEEAKESDQEEHNSEGGVVGSSPNAEFEHAPGHEAVVHVEGDEDQENDAAGSACVLVDSLVVSLVNFVVARLIFLHYLKFIRDNVGVLGVLGFWGFGVVVGIGG